MGESIQLPAGHAASETTKLAALPRYNGASSLGNLAGSPRHEGF
jgi:hypothetical protein